MKEEERMRKFYFLGGSTAIALLGSIALATAATGPSTFRNSVALTSAQQRTISNGINGNRQVAPSTFHASVGRTVPKSLMLKPLPQAVTRRVPSIKGDDYVALRNQEVLVVRPLDRKVVAVIKDWADASLGG
jgi:hypothetical protein